MTIVDYLDSIKTRLLTDPIIASFQVIRERATITDGHMRARLTLSDGGWIEFSEYVQLSQNNEIQVITYSYHWAADTDALIQRWDNTPHFPNLPGFPHHIHLGPSQTVHPGTPINIFEVLDKVAETLT